MKEIICNDKKTLDIIKRKMFQPQKVIWAGCKLLTAKATETLYLSITMRKGYIYIKKLNKKNKLDFQIKQLNFKYIFKFEILQFISPISKKQLHKFSKMYLKIIKVFQNVKKIYKSKYGALNNCTNSQVQTS